MHIIYTCTGSVEKEVPTAYRCTTGSTQHWIEHLACCLSTCDDTADPDVSEARQSTDIQTRAAVCLRRYQCRGRKEYMCSCLSDGLSSQLLISDEETSGHCTTLLSQLWMDLHLPIAPDTGCPCRAEWLSKPLGIALQGWSGVGSRQWDGYWLVFRSSAWLR